MAEVLCQSSPDSIRTLKKSIEAGRQLPLNEALSQSKKIAACYESSAVYQQNLQDFIDKKEPAFKTKKK